MLARFPLAILATALVMTLASAAPAYEINPLKNKYHGGGPGGLWEHITEPVHEEITYAAVRCAEARMAAGAGANPPPCVVPDVAVPLTPRGNKVDALIRGVWWNDDPNQNLFSVRYATWAAWMNDAHTLVAKHHNWLGRDVRLTNRYKMQYRSHYGDLQFLHAMANEDGDAPAVVRKRILDWIGFAYAVASRKLEPDTVMADVDFPVAKSYFSAQPGWTVNHLFGPTYTLGKATIPDVALGSILHVVQDSFSDAHAARAQDATTACPTGRIVQFHSYGKQDSKLHRTADMRAAWRDGKFTPELNPVEASAVIVRFAREGADWNGVVEPYLRRTVFCIDADAQPSGPGRYASAA